MSLPRSLTQGLTSGIVSFLQSYLATFFPLPIVMATLRFGCIQGLKTLVQFTRMYILATELSRYSIMTTADALISDLSKGSDEPKKNAK